MQAPRHTPHSPLSTLSRSEEWILLSSWDFPSSHCPVRRGLESVLHTGSSFLERFRQTGRLGREDEIGELGRGVKTGDLGRGIRTGDLWRKAETGDLGREVETGDLGQKVETGDLGRGVCTSTSVAAGGPVASVATWRSHVLLS